MSVTNLDGGGCNLVEQLDALNFIISLFQAFTCFEHMCSSSGGQIVLYSLWYHHTETSEWSKMTKIIKIIKIQFYKYENMLILTELYFNNFNYFSNFRRLTCFSVMIPETV